MPWTPDSFKEKHNHGLSKPKAKEAAKIANALLREGKSDSSAIRIANWKVKH